MPAPAGLGSGRAGRRDAGTHLVTICVTSHPPATAPARNGTGRPAPTTGDPAPAGGSDQAPVRNARRLGLTGRMRNSGRRWPPGPVVARVMASHSWYTSRDFLRSTNTSP